ncbi:hypothetical protein GW17_00033175 [Ensete ventricosum]|nr:hypothetical protein GW17_00033175 [Ensete ventricosum]
MSGEPCRRDGEQWFFFCPRREREARGGRPTRTTPSGYWKATGSPSLVYSSANRVMGVKKTMVFYQGRAPTGTKTEWKMNEYRAVEEGASSISTSLASQTRSEYCLCRMYTKSECIRLFDRRPSSSSSSSSSSAAAAAAAATNTDAQRMPEVLPSGWFPASANRPSSYGDSSRRSVRQSGEDDLWLITDDECYSLQDWF